MNAAQLDLDGFGVAPLGDADLLDTDGGVFFVAILMGIAVHYVIDRTID